MFIITLSAQVWQITLARAYLGMASALLWLSVKSIPADITGKRDQGHSFGGIPQASYQGATVGTFIGFGVLTTAGFKRGWCPLFTVYRTLYLTAIVLVLIYIPEINSALAHHGERRPLPCSSAWILLLVLTAVICVSWAMVMPILIIFLQKRLNTDVANLGQAYFPAAVIWAILSSRLGAIDDLFGRKFLIILGLIAASSSSFYILQIPGCTLSLPYSIFLTARFKSPTSNMLPNHSGRFKSSPHTFFLHRAI
jgi:hypothetical protein